MATEAYVIQLTEEQRGALTELFKARNWELEIQTYNRYQAMQDTAEDYVDNQQAKPPDQTSDVQRRMRLHSEPASLSTTRTNVNHEKFKGSFHSMKNMGTSYNALRSSGRNSGETIEQPEYAEKKAQNNWRLSTWNPGDEEKEMTSNLLLKHYCVADDTTVKVITQLSTEHVQTVSRVPVRIVLLVDRSGSMLHKIGRDGRHSKITKVKHFAKQLVSGLDEGDEVALVTFGDVADVFFPLEKLNSNSRSRILQTLNSLDKGGMSRQTNLSAGLRMSLKVFFDATKSEAQYISTKNSILIFSDGDINAGTTDTGSLLHEVRQNIRQMVPRLDDSQNQWVTISVVTTGGAVSEQAYMLSKTCSSEAYYYIDKDAEDPEADLFLPVLLRKTAVAWNVSCVVEAFHGLTFVDEKCTRDNRVRLRRSLSGRAKSSEKAYFLYDFPAGTSRQVGVCADWSATNKLAGVEDGEKVLSVRVEFTNINGDRFWQEQAVLKSDIMKAAEGKFDIEADTAAYKHDLRMMSSDVLRNAAEFVKAGNKLKCAGVMRDGQNSLQTVLSEYGAKAQEQETNTVQKAELNNYVKGVMDNLSALIDGIEKASTGVSWNRIKAVSTAITRESPNVSDTVVGEDILCPLPDVSHMETGALKEPMTRMQEKKKAQKRVTFGNLDDLLDGLSNKTYGKM